MKQPRLDVRDALVRPTTRSLLAFLARTEEPIRVRTARETLKISIGQIGLAMRTLERHGLALRRNLPVDAHEGPRLQHTFLEATDLGREHARGLTVETVASVPAA